MSSPDALFLGPGAENRELFSELCNTAFDTACDIRANHRPELGAWPIDKQSPEYIATANKQREVLKEIADGFVDTCPFFTPLYCGHMASDQLTVAHAAYLTAAVHHPNSIAYDSAPFANKMEIQVIAELSTMFGYDPRRSFGYLSAGGTTANIQALWVARNLKNFAVATSRLEATKHLVAGKSDYELLTMSPDAVLALLEEVKSLKALDDVKSMCRHSSVLRAQNGVIFCPRTKHYSIPKACEMLGVGNDQIIQIPVDDDYSVNMKIYREQIIKCCEAGIPIIATIAVVGTTEEGSFDDISQLFDIREECEKKYNSSWSIHADAAYGGMIASMFVKEDGTYMTLEETREYYKDQLVAEWPKAKIHRAFASIHRADSITCDPHKHFLPFGVGAIMFRDYRFMEVTTYAAAYVFDQSAKMNTGVAPNVALQTCYGASSLEGTRSGALAASVYAAYKVCPLDRANFGKVFARGLKTTQMIIQLLENKKHFIVGDRKFHIELLHNPEFQMFNFALREEGDMSLENMNKLNHFLMDQFSFVTAPMYELDFVTASTSFVQEEYGDVPLNFVKRMGFPESEWFSVKDVFVFRLVCCTPFINEQDRFETYWRVIIQAFQTALEKYCQ